MINVSVFFFPCGLWCVLHCCTSVPCQWTETSAAAWTWTGTETETRTHVLHTHSRLCFPDVPSVWHHDVPIFEVRWWRFWDAFRLNDKSSLLTVSCMIYVWSHREGLFTVECEGFIFISCLRMMRMVKKQIHLCWQTLTDGGSPLTTIPSVIHHTWLLYFIRPSLSNKHLHRSKATPIVALKQAFCTKSLTWVAQDVG